MSPEPSGWLTVFRAILDSSVWKTSALAVAAGLILYGNGKRWFPVVFEPWAIEVLIVTLVVCICLSLVAVIPNIVSMVKRADLWNVHRAKHLVNDCIPHLTAKEREIIAYLLDQNQRMFETTPDGGYASTLISKAIVACAVQPGQQVRAYAVPFEVPKHVWNVLLKRKAEFPFEPPEPGQRRTFPWAITWELG